jgi:diaminopimelate epimerase
MSEIPHYWYRMHGCGNHFSVVIDHEGQFPRLSNDQARLIADPNTGLGGDGLLIIRPRNQSKDGEIIVEMFNPDGSNMGMCGNGIRCVAEAWDRFTGPQAKGSYVFNVEGRRIHCMRSALKEGLWQVAMGKFTIQPKEVPHGGELPCIDTLLTIEAGTTHPVTCVGMGNPHCVLFVDDIYNAPVESLGRKIEHHPFFPKRSNVEFVTITSSNSIAMRVWERGAGETKACGTGACASAVAAILNNKISEREVLVKLIGGELLIRVDMESNEVTLTGPAEWIVRGEICEELLDAVKNTF